MEESIVLFKLTSGEEVIAKVIGQEGQVFVLHKPYAFTYTQNKNGSMDGGIMRWLGQSADGTVTLNAHQVVATTEPNENIIDAYKKSTGEKPNIEVPKKEIILG